jgi:hypothetical protein
LTVAALAVVTARPDIEIERTQATESLDAVHRRDGHILTKS